MTSAETPAVARRRLRLALRRAREAKKLTQGQVAETFEWSLSKVQRIESGEVNVSNTDLRALLALFGVTDRARIDGLLADARAARSRGWWDEPRYREHLTSATVQMLQYENEASAIRIFQPLLVPGQLQTDAYSASVLEFWSDELSTADRTVRLDVRSRRREALLSQDDPAQHLILIDESVLDRTLPGRKAMADQLDLLTEVSRSPQFLIRIMPLETAPLSLLGHFMIFDLGDEENAVLYREAALQDEIIQTTERIRVHRERFEQAWELSLSESASGRLIAARAAALRAELDRLR